MTMAIADPRTADNCANRTCNDRAGCAADRRTGYRSFSTARRICRDGQGGECRECGGDDKFAHVSSTVRFAEERANTGKVHPVKNLFRLTSRNAARSNCEFE